MSVLLGIDIGGTAVKAGLVDETGAILLSETRSVDFDGYRTPILTTVTALARELLEKSPEKPAGIGVSATGQIDVRSGTVIGVGASLAYELVIMVVPVGAYYKGGIKPVDAMISRDYDRAAPHGTGHIKAAGNYAASLISSKPAKDRHCAVALFLDPATHAARIAIEGLPWFALGFICFIVNLTAIGYYQSLERVGIASGFALLRGFVFLVPSFLFMPRLGGTEGIWLAMPLSELLTALVILGVSLWRRQRIG